MARAEARAIKFGTFQGTFQSASEIFRFELTAPIGEEADGKLHPKPEE
jgi:hypothetical protein